MTDAQNHGENSGADPVENASEAADVDSADSTDVQDPGDAGEENRPMTVLPGSGGTVTGTAIHDWLDDEGNPRPDDVDDSSHEQPKSAETPQQAQEEPPD